MRLLLDLLLPATCAACTARAAEGLCAGCGAAAAQLVLPDRGEVLLGDGVRAVAAFSYDGVVADAIRRIKVRGEHAGAPALGRLLRHHVPWPSGVPVTWVPSTRRRARERGIELPRALAGPDAVRLLHRVLERPDQTELPPSVRLVNPRGAFAPAGPVPPAVVLVDDVRTTGATAAAAAAALRGGGADRVLVVTLAAAQPRERAAPSSRCSAVASG